MNPIIIILLLFSVLGIVSKLTGRWELGDYVDKGAAAANASLLPYVGITVIGSLIVNQITVLLYGHESYVPSILTGSLLSPDFGGLKLSQQLAPNEDWGLFTGLILSGCIGQFISFQLPVLKAAIGDRKTSANLMQGFALGLITMPFGILAGGMILGISVPVLILRSSPILFLCTVIALGLWKKPLLTERVLEVAATGLSKLCLAFFALTAVLIIVNPGLILDSLHDCMFAYIRLVVIIAGGTVLAGMISRHMNADFAKKILHINSESFIGLILNAINSLAMAPLWRDMDEQGQKMNAAFAVSGAYMIGGQLTFAAGTGSRRAVAAYLAAKITAGFLGVALVAVIGRRTEKRADGKVHKRCHLIGL